MDEQTFFLIDDGRSMLRWCTAGADKEGEPVWIDLKGRSIPRKSAKPLAHVTGATSHVTIVGVPPAIADLERRSAMKHLLDPWSDQGWVSPDGRFYGCKFFQHDDLAHALLRKSVRDLEVEGWVRVHSDLFLRDAGSRREQMSRRQQDTLEALGFDLDNPGPFSRRFVEPDRSGPPPRYAYRGTLGAVQTGAAEVAPPAAEPAKATVADVVARLREHDQVAPLFDRSARHLTDFGGRWTWMLDFEDVFLGAEAEPAELCRADGLKLVATAWDQIEVLEWPEPGIHVDPEVASILTPTRSFAA